MSMPSKFKLFVIVIQAHTIPRNTFLIQNEYLKYYLPRYQDLSVFTENRKFMSKSIFSTDTNRYVDHTIIYDHVCRNHPDAILS